MHSWHRLTIITLAVIGLSSCVRSAAEVRAIEARLEHRQEQRIERPMTTHTEVPTAHPRITVERARTAAPASANDPLMQALAAYENARSRLALDDLPGAKSEVRKLTAANQPLVQLVATARTFDAAPELASARSAFGVLSQHVIRLLIERPALRAGRSLYFCPMVHTYNKWVQSSGPIDNPYIGKHMTHCGVELAAWDAAS
jgi:hypothetical protein